MCYDDNWRRGNGPPGAPWRDFWHRTPALRPWSLSCAGFSARSAEPASSEAQMPIHYDYPPGVTAIQPSRHVTDRSQAAYGRAEVERYLESNPRLMRGVPGGPSPKLGTVEFLPASQASARVNYASIGRPDDALVCWVELIGPFDVSKSVSIPPFLARKSGPLSFAPAPKQILVFDPQTGNLLLSYYSK